jgi:hypothetical protein
VLFTRNEHAVDVDEPPAGFSQGDESTVSAGMWNAAGQRSNSSQFTYQLVS